MAVPQEYRSDVAAILARRHDNGADFWATPDGRWGTGSPFSTFDCVLLLTELGLPSSDRVMRGAAEVLLGAWREDGRVRPAPRGSIYPCHTANALRALCRLGRARDRRVQRSFAHLLDTQHTDGGWRCGTVRLGKDERTDASNPGVTLAVLDALRFAAAHRADARLEAAVDHLLGHWRTRKPLGPCAFGIGTLFGKTEFPFLRYNLFAYVHVLSFYPAAHARSEFREALETLGAKTRGGALVVENPHRRLAKLALCRRGEPSRAATKRYREILRNVSP